MMLARERSLLVEDVVDVLRALLVEQLHVGRAERAFVGAHGWAFSPLDCGGRVQKMRSQGTPLRWSRRFRPQSLL